ncbi:hypothetical protein [Caldimonas sp. KR1-144]|uniref:hypothetical protein n=1 Tax=Caldimonas sp. KR1-144 TaxID=3400911 RepID=UPI003BFB3FA2
MKHLVLLLAAVIGLYVAWQLTAPLKREKALGLAARHAWRLGAMVLIVLALAAASYHFSSTPLLKP